VSEGRIGVWGWGGLAGFPMTLPDISGSLTVIWGRSATDVYAAGYDNTNPNASVALLLHYDGTTWTTVASTESQWEALCSSG